MSLLTAAIVTVILSTLIMGGVFATLKVKRQRSESSGKDDGLAEIATVTGDLRELTRYRDSYLPPAQHQFVARQADDLLAQLEAERATLKGIEAKLEIAQKEVEKRELEQQELKTARAEDEAKLTELLGRYADISGEGIALEQRLAASMKNLDTMMSEIELSQDQRAMFEDLQRTLTEGSGRLRDLMMEYQTVKERLDMLNQQHRDLEDEYTKLVEQQLGD